MQLATATAGFAGNDITEFVQNSSTAAEQAALYQEQTDGFVNTIQELVNDANNAAAEAAAATAEQ